MNQISVEENTLKDHKLEVNLQKTLKIQNCLENLDLELSTKENELPNFDKNIINSDSLNNKKSG